MPQIAEHGHLLCILTVQKETKSLQPGRHVSWFHKFLQISTATGAVFSHFAGGSLVLSRPSWILGRHFSAGGKNGVGSKGSGCSKKRHIASASA